MAARSRLDQHDLAVAVSSLPGNETVAAGHADLAERIDEASGFNRQGKDDTEIGRLCSNRRSRIRMNRNRLAHDENTKETMNEGMMAK